MIEYSDNTLIEANGQFDQVDKLMKVESPKTWMLSSLVIVDAKLVMARYLIHFWNNGNAVIMETDHPAVVEIPDDDIIELNNWCIQNNWKLFLHKDLLRDPTGFNFWLRLYRAGVVRSDFLQEHEQEEMDRFAKVFNSSKDN
jgi:hypothetical protein